MTTEKEAIRILKGMRTIVKNEMLRHGVYVTDTPIPEKKNNLCRGYQMCAVGSMWVAAGIKPVVEYGASSLPGTDLQYRDDFLFDKPALYLAYTTMNKVCEKYGRKHYGEEWRSSAGAYEGAMEVLFEEFMGDSEEPMELATNEEREILIKLIDKAIKRIKK